MVKMLDIHQPNLPKNVNGVRTAHTCELCGFEPKTKNKYREKQDHLVMKHFKEKIDKIFPHCRPYACPTPECGFTGKDKQALLRHYTGKHGILERYLREALAEKGISFVPGESGKRKSSTDSNHSKAKKLHTTTQIIDAKDMLPKNPVPFINGTTNGSTTTVTLHHQNGVINNRSNNEELRKEVEAMMASFQPQPQEVRTTVSNAMPALLPTAPVPVTTAMAMENGEKKIILSSKLPPLNSITSQPPSTVVSLVKRGGEVQVQNNPKQPTIILASSNGQTTQIPELILPDSMAENGLQAIPIEVIAQVASANGGQNGHAVTEGQLNVVENDTMWGAGGLGPAVVVETADTIPVHYIEASEIVYSSAANLDNIDYDYLYPVSTASAVTTATTTVEAVPQRRERQLEFNML